MKSTAVYRLIREIVGPWCKGQGFQRTESGMLGWYKPVRDAFLVFWFQCSQDGWDNYAGSKLIVEFQLSSEAAIGVGTNRARLPHFLNEKQLEEMRNIQNAVISTLPHPPQDYPFLHISPDITQWYLDKFKPVSKPYRNTDDVWLRYYSDGDVRQWADFVAKHLPIIVAGFEDNQD